MHLEVLIHPQGIHGRGIKSCKEHIYNNQDIQFPVLHTHREVFIVVLEALGRGIVVTVEHLVIVLNSIVQRVSAGLIHAIHFKCLFIRICFIWVIAVDHSYLKIFLTVFNLSLQFFVITDSCFNGLCSQDTIKARHMSCSHSLS